MNVLEPNECVLKELLPAWSSYTNNLPHNHPCFVVRARNRVSKKEPLDSLFKWDTPSKYLVTFLSYDFSNKYCSSRITIS